MSCCIKDPETLTSYEIDKDLKKQQATIRKQVSFRKINLIFWFIGTIDYIILIMKSPRWPTAYIVNFTVCHDYWRCACSNQSRCACARARAPARANQPISLALPAKPRIQVPCSFSDFLSPFWLMMQAVLFGWTGSSAESTMLVGIQLCNWSSQLLISFYQHSSSANKPKKKL